MSKIDWSKAGKRIRWQSPNAVDGFRNPDWLWVQQRWKDEADYYGEELTASQIVQMLACPRCESLVTWACTTEDRQASIKEPHRERRRAAGETLLKLHGPRFTKG